MITASDCCFMLLSVAVALAAALAWAKTGKRMAARIAIIAITTSSSMSVKALVFLILGLQNLRPAESNARGAFSATRLNQGHVRKDRKFIKPVNPSGECLRT